MSGALLLLLHLLLLGASAESPSSSEDVFEVTALFEIAANSTCGGDPPTFFVYDGEVFNCSVGDHPAGFALDDNPNTWWQSSNGDDPVSITLSLGELESTLNLVVTNIQLTVRRQVSNFYYWEIRGKNPTFYQRMAHVTDTSFCANLTIPCNVISMEDGVIDLAFLDVPFDQPIAEISLTLSGGDFQSTELSYYTIVEMAIFAQVADGFYLRSLRNIKVEGEVGIILSTSDLVHQSSDSSLFRGFSGRGFAFLNYSEFESDVAQWSFPSLPTSSDYQIGFIYSNHVRRSRRRPVTLMQEERSFDARVTFLGDCMACTAFVSPLDATQVTEPANFSLTESMLTVTMSLSAINISLDAIVAIPRHYFDAISLGNQSRDHFLTACNLTSVSFMDSFCLRNAQKLSIEFFNSTYACSCDDAFSINSNCESYGGQCDCISALSRFSAPIGRQCGLCPFYFYHTVYGCDACTCPDRLDECDLETGACSSCPPLSMGARCESCISNSYRDENTDSCLPCNCDRVGSISCNQTSGQCECKEGVGGDSCNQCDVTYFNYSSNGCMSCECGLGSLNGSCDTLGQCYCKEGASGMKCASCLDGFYSLSSQGCIPCYCSNRTNQCSLASNSSSGSSPQEICDCPFPFTGLSCESCIEGYYVSAISGLCELCNCSGRASRCADGDGQCINCTDNSSGSNCEICIEGLYDADPSTNLSCQTCPCTEVTAVNTSCTSDSLGQPSCYCLPGHLPPMCNNCTDGYFGLPPTTRCTDCSCNGNIDNTVPGSCNPITGQCIICINNSTGPECELCLPGYFGNATIQDCQLCNCDDEGSATSLCDSDSGQCTCLEGVGGVRCDQCQDGYWNFRSDIGCQQCQCSEASNNSICNFVTGQCVCKYGVEGINCSSCMKEFYNFSEDGCSECNCGLGSVSGSCSDDGGICYCLPAVTGTKCDQCLPFHFFLSSSGCQSCSGCEGMLVQQLTVVEAVVASSRLNMSLFLGLIRMDVTGYFMFDSTFWELIQRRIMTSLSLDSTEMYLTTLNESALDSTIMQSLLTKEQVEAALRRAALIQPRAVNIQEHVLVVHRTMQEVFIDTGSVNLFVVTASNLIIVQANVAMVVRANTSMVTTHSLTNLSDVQYQETRSCLLVARDNVSTLLDFVIGLHNHTNWVELKYENLELLLNLKNTGTLLSDLHSNCSELLNLSAQLTPKVVSVINSTFEANLTLSLGDVAIARAQSLLFLARSDVYALTQAIISVVDEDMSGSGDVISGSGMIIDEAVIPYDNSIANSITALQSSIDQLSTLFSFHKDVNAIAIIADILLDTSDINNTLIPALDQSDLASQVIRNYSSVMNKLSQIYNITNVTSTVLQNVVKTLLSDDVSIQNLSHVNTSSQLLYAAQSQFSNVRNLHVISNITQMQVNYLYRNLSYLNPIVRQLASDVSTTTKAIVNSDLHRTLVEVGDQFNVVENVSSQSSSSLSINQTLFILAEIQSTSISADMMLNVANSSAIATQSSIMNRTSLLSRASKTAGTSQLKLDRMNSTLSTLQSRMTQALAAAATIDVALQFYGNLSFSYSLPDTSASSLESVSLTFNPEHISYGDLLGSLNGDALLQINNGSVQMNYGAGVISAGSGLLQANQWYQLYATRDVNQAILSLMSLPENGSIITVNAVVNEQSVLFSGTVAIGSNYSGCLDRLIINNRQLSLLDPLEREDLNICGPRLPSEPDREFGNGVWLLGAGSYIRVYTQQSLSSEFDLRFYFRTLDASGVLLFYPGTNGMQYLAIYINDGRLAVDYQLSTADTLQLRTESLYNTGLWYEVYLQVDGVNVTAIINQSESVVGSSSRVMNTDFVPSDILMVGGLFANYSGTLSTISSIAGCVRDLEVNELLINFRESESERVDFSGCPEVVASGVRFMGYGRAEFAVAEEEFSNITIEFRTTQLASLLLHFDVVSVAIFHSMLRVDVQNSLVLVSDVSGLNDNMKHTATLVLLPSGNSSMISLSVDGIISATSYIPRKTVITEKIYVGGINSFSEIPVKEGFRGCINALIFNGRQLSFDDADVLVHVSLYGCRGLSEESRLSQPILPPPPLSPPPSLLSNRSVGLSGRNGSFIAIQVAEPQVLESFSIILDFMTISSEGILLYMQGTVYDDYLSLQLVSGQLLFSYNLGSGRAQIRSSGYYNDGTLHRVEVQRRSRAGQLLVDGSIEARGLSSGTFSSLNTDSSYLFLGGVPAMLTPLSVLSLEQQRPLSVPACFSAFAINGVFEDLNSPQASSGVEQCLPLYNNGVTFHGDSYLLMRKEFYVGVELNISVDFRTNTCSGLLLYVASSIYPDHLLVELRNGCVVLVFNNGPMREELQSCNTEQLCDGIWHSLFVSKSGLTGTIIVDRTPPETLTSSCDICQNFLAINTDDPLYVGGIPDTVRSRYTVETGSFEGCLSNLNIFRESAKPEALLFSQAAEHKNVEFNSCTL